MIQANPAPRRSRRGLWLALAASVASVVVLLAVVDVRAAADQVRQSDWRLLAAASAALLAGMACYTTRWQRLLGESVSWLSTLQAAAVGQAVNLLVPLRAGEAARILVMSRRPGLSLSAVTSSVVVERLWEQVLRVTALVGAIALGAGLRPSTVALLAGVGLVGAAALVVVLLRRHQYWVLTRLPQWLARLPRLEEPAVRESLARLLAGLALATSPRRLVDGAVFSLAAWACFWAFQALALLALPVDLTTRQALTLSLSALALAPPSAPTAPGIYHASIVVPLALVGYAETTLTAYAVVVHALMLFWLLPLGLLAMLRSGVSAREVLPAA